MSGAYQTCPACSSPFFERLPVEGSVIERCMECSAKFGYVPEADLKRELNGFGSSADESDSEYFDFFVVPRGNEAPWRTHGWRSSSTKKVYQFG